MFRRKWILSSDRPGHHRAGGAAAYFSPAGRTGHAYRRRSACSSRDLEAIVSASGKIDPKKTVNISAQSMGRVTRLAVNEGDRVKAGQFLLQIDPVAAESAVRRDEASVAGGAHRARTGAHRRQERADEPRARAAEP